MKRRLFLADLVVCRSILRISSANQVGGSTRIKDMTEIKFGRSVCQVEGESCLLPR